MHRYFNSNDPEGLTKWFSREVDDTFVPNSSSHYNRTVPFTPPTNTSNQLRINGGHTPSVEQQSIVESVIQGNNVIVDSVFGSGKTTTILEICKAINSTPT